MKNIFYAILAWVWSAVICAEPNDTIKPLYPCSDLLERAYGVCSHITRPHVDYERHDEQLRLMREAGMSMVRSDLDFYNFMNDEGISHTSIFNNVISSCRKSDVGLLGILTNPNRYAWGNAPLYEKYLRALARQYNRQIDYWEVFNEVNLFRGVDKLPQRYAEALQTTYKILKSENPDNKVVLTGMAEVHNSFLDDICKEGAHKYFDIMNFHSYLEPEQLIPSFHKIKEVMDRYGWHKPVWLTECGMHTAQDDNPHEGFYTDLLETEQARRVARIYLLAWAHGVNKVFWYNLCASENDKTEKEDNFGLLHRDLSPKPSYVAYQTLTRFCPDGSTRPVLVRNNDIYQARWTRPDGSRIYAAWCSSGRREIRHDLSPKAKWYDYLGREIKVGKSLTLTTSVVYGVENANQHWKNVKVESTIEGVQPMTGLVLWPYLHNKYFYYLHLSTLTLCGRKPHNTIQQCESGV